VSEFLKVAGGYTTPEVALGYGISEVLCSLSRMLEKLGRAELAERVKSFGEERYT